MRPGTLRQLLTPVKGAGSDTPATILPLLALTQTKRHCAATHCAVLTHRPHRAENIPKGNLGINTARKKTKNKIQTNQTTAEMSVNVNKQKSLTLFDLPTLAVHAEGRDICYSRSFPKGPLKMLHFNFALK